jgi:hypothetical protein
MLGLKSSAASRSGQRPPRHVVPKPAQAYEPVVPVKVREWIRSALASPDLVLEAQPPAQPRSRPHAFCRSRGLAPRRSHARDCGQPSAASRSRATAINTRPGFHWRSKPSFSRRWSTFFSGATRFLRTRPTSRPRHFLSRTGAGTALLPVVLDSPAQRIDHSGRRLRVETAKGTVTG